jgi:RNA polymerase sigma-70 factor (ECF subfamily)
MTDTTDQSLIDRAKAGDARAMEQVLAKYETRVYRFGLRMCGNEDDARDVLQETLLSAFKNLSTFRGDAQLSTWLYQVARSFCLKQRRRHEG